MTTLQRQRVLVIEDDPNVAEVVAAYLEREGCLVQVCVDGEAGLATALADPPDLVVLDLMLPGLDGLEVCRRLQALAPVPVVMLTAKGDETDRIVGLELGADDYITKPFSPREVVARVKAAVRRSGVATATPHLVLGRVEVDRDAHKVRVDGAEIELTATEFDLLVHLMRTPGRVLSREQLLSEVWGYAAVVGTRTVDVHVAQVRAKLGDASPIRTVRGVGYSAEAP